MARPLGDGIGIGIKRHTYPQNAEMNVTPFVDVMLVLLIIFMVAAPLAVVDIPLELPPASVVPAPIPAEPVYISLQKDGSIYIQNDRTTLEALGPLLLEKTRKNRDNRIFVRGDEHLEYGRLMAIMNLLQQNGYSKVGLVAQEHDAP